MLQKVDPDQVQELGRGMKRLNRSIEDRASGMIRDLKRVVQETRNTYPESYVQYAIVEIESLISDIEKSMHQVYERLDEKQTTLIKVAEHYRQVEAKVEEQAKTLRSQPLKFTWTKQLGNLFLDASIAKEQKSADSASKLRIDALSLMDRIKEWLLRVKEPSIVRQLEPFKEDPRIASLLKMADAGSIEEQKWAMRQLQQIAGSFTELSRSQTAYQIYSQYGNMLYMEGAHQQAQSQRALLAELGVSETWYGINVNLSSQYKGSPLNACTYNPLKTDGSRMPTEGELRFVIAAGMLNESYREWAKKNYNEIEASVKKMVAQRQELQDTIDTYNRTISREQIIEMQKYLKKMNIYSGEVTGEYNVEFLIAVSGYQHIANTVSTMAAARGNQFELNGKIDDQLLSLARSESSMGYYNNPDMKLSPTMTVAAVTAVGIGDGIVSQLADDGKDIIQSVWSTMPSNPDFWLKTIPESYELGKAIVNGEITLTDIKNSVGNGLAEEYVQPFKDIERLSSKVLSGKATYEENVAYGRAVAKVAQVVFIAASLVKSGSKLAVGTANKLKNLLPETYEKIQPFKKIGFEMGTSNGINIKGFDPNIPETPPLPKTETQKNYLEFYNNEKGIGGTGKSSPDAIRKVDNNILDRMESAGGHTVDRHVSKTNEELIKRAIQEDVEAATSFTDKNTAIKAIQENLRKNADDIAEWLNESDTGRKIFDVSHKNPVGKGVLEDKKQVIYDLTDSRVVLIRDSTQELGFKILTGFPIIK